MLHISISMFLFSINVFKENPHRIGETMWRVFRFFLGIALATMLSYSAAHAQSNEVDGQDSCQVNDLIPLSLTGLWTGDLEKEQYQCFVLEMKEGSFARLRLGLEIGAIKASLFAPADTSSVMQVYANEEEKERVMAWAADMAGSYLLRIEALQRTMTMRVQLESLESPELYAARVHTLEANPRVRSLSDHMLKLNSVDPNDDDFSDLLLLRNNLNDVRIVMLGEASHHNGTDFLAKGRLIRFLHSELGFDILAFEAGFYNMSKTWEAIRSGEDPHKAFSKGAFWMWALSAQVEPLVRYVSNSLNTDRPLELAGIDIQVSARAPELPHDLREFLLDKDFPTPFTNPKSPESEILTGLSEVRFRTREKAFPDSVIWFQFVESLARTADEIGNLEPTRETMYWKRVLVNMGYHARMVFYMYMYSKGLRLPTRENDRRDQQMAENLIWMIEEFYPGRKIIVWAHSGHILRASNELIVNPDLGITLGDAVWKVFKNQMYSIAPVSYGGSFGFPNLINTIVPDQYPEAEFEELMAATGQSISLVDLRQGIKQDRWFGGSFIARPIGNISMRSVWSHHFDAFLFLKTQEPNNLLEE